MFFSFSLAAYYTVSNLVTNRHKFVAYLRDNKRKPPSREFPVEDISSLLCLTSERTLFLDEIHNNFLDLTLIEQQEIFVDFLLKQFGDCLTGLASNIIINDVCRLHSLKTSNDSKKSYHLEGNFGSLVLPSGNCPYNAETSQQLLSTITTPRLAAFSPPHHVFSNNQSGVDYSFNHHICLPTTLSAYSYPLVNAFCNQSLSAEGSGCIKYHRDIASTPAFYSVVIQHNAESMKVSFCRRVVQYVTYRSVPVTVRVTKIFLTTERKCVSLFIYKAKHPVAVGRGLFSEERRTTFHHPLPITFFTANVRKDTSLPLPISQMTSNEPVIQPTQNNDSQTSANETNPPQASIRPALPCLLNLHGLITTSFHREHTTSPPSHHNRQDIINKSNDATPEPVPVCNHHVTPQPPQVPVSPWVNRIPGGKAAAAPPSKTDFAQHNRQTDVTKNQRPVVGQLRMLGQESRTSVGVVDGRGNTAINFNNPFGWGATANVGFCHPVESKAGKQIPQNPAGGVIGGEVNKQTPACNTIKQGSQAAAKGTIWNTSKPCSQRRNTNITSYGQTSSHHLLNTRKPNHRAPAPLYNINNNFDLGATNQAAGPGFMLWGANPVVPQSLMKAIPKALAKGSSVDQNNNLVHKYKLPSSCKAIPWSDLEEVNDRRTKMPKTLGSGAFGVVKLMKQTSSGRLCAVKINRDNVDKQTAIRNLQLEVGFLSLLKDLECVPELFGITEPNTNPQLPVVVQEFIGDSNTFRSVTLLYALKAKVLPAPKAIRVALRVCEAVKDIHSRKLLHCDLKTDNIMLEPNFIREDNPKIKVIDFGLAVKMDDKPKYQCNSRADIPWILTHCRQVAPEVVRGEMPYNVVSEVYSLGIIFKHLSYRFGGFLQKLGEDCRNLDYNLRPSLDDVIQRIKAHLASNQL